MKTALKLVSSRPPERVFGTPEFIGLTRKVGLASPSRFEPTVKGIDDVVI
jgi:hypothetical protein